MVAFSMVSQIPWYPLGNGGNNRISLRDPLWDFNDRVHVVSDTVIG